MGGDFFLRGAHFGTAVFIFFGHFRCVWGLPFLHGFIRETVSKFVAAETNGPLPGVCPPTSEAETSREQRTLRHSWLVTWATVHFSWVPVVRTRRRYDRDADVMMGL